MKAESNLDLLLSSFLFSLEPIDGEGRGVGEGASGGAPQLGAQGVVVVRA